MHRSPVRLRKAAFSAGGGLALFCGARFGRALLRRTAAQRQEFLSGRRNVHFFFNRITDEKLAMDANLYNSLMVRLLVGNPQDPAISPYFKLVYDNVFCRIYEVL